MTIRKPVAIAGIALSAGILLAACGGSSPTTPPATSPVAAPPVATSPAAPAGNTGSSSSNPDANACNDLKGPAVALLANPGTSTLTDFSVALTTAQNDDYGSTSNLTNDLSALAGDINTMISNGGTAPASAATDQSSVASDCAAAGVPMPSGFAG